MLARAENPGDFVAKLNLATYYNISAAYLSDTQIVNSLTTANYDVFLLGSSGNEVDANNMTTQAANKIIAFAQSGGGVVTFSMLPTQLTDNTLYTLLQPVIPIKMGGTTFGGCVPNDYPQMAITNSSHPIATSLASYFGFAGLAQWSTLGLSPGAVSIASVTGASSCSNLNAQTSVQGVVVSSYGSSRLVWLCPAYSTVYVYTSENLRIGETEQLLEASLWWASKIPAWCPNGCQNGGKCVAPNQCNCAGTGYIGSSCSTPSCPNGCVQGTCTKPNTCVCKSGWTGTACQTPICDFPCRNNGTCIGPNTCNCTSQYTGSFCQNVNCNGITCFNGGTCLGVGSGCSCTTGWNGTYCENPICTIPCANGTPCMGPNQCNCSSVNFAGPQCNSPKCVPGCQHGTCIAFGTCSCPNDTWTGQYCEIPVCDPPCENGRACLPDNVCDCGYNYAGDRCEEPVCRPQCFHGGDCVAPQVCNCTSTEYDGKYCEIPLPPPTATETDDTNTYISTQNPTVPTRSMYNRSSSTRMPRSSSEATTGGVVSGEVGLSRDNIIIIAVGGVGLCLLITVGSFFMFVCCGKKNPPQQPQQFPMMRTQSAVNMPSMGDISLHAVDEDDLSYTKSDV